MTKSSKMSVGKRVGRYELLQIATELCYVLGKTLDYVDPVVNRTAKALWLWTLCPCRSDKNNNQLPSTPEKYQKVVKCWQAMEVLLQIGWIRKVCLRQWHLSGTRKKESVMWKSGGRSFQTESTVDAKTLSGNKPRRRARPGYLECSEQPENCVE